MDKGSKQQALFLTEAVIKFFLQCQLDTSLSQSQNVQEMQHVTIAWEPQRMRAEVQVDDCLRMQQRCGQHGFFKTHGFRYG